MKIIILTMSYAMIAGVERLLSDKMNYMAERGYEITMVTYEQGNHVFPLEGEGKLFEKVSLPPPPDSSKTFISQRNAKDRGVAHVGRPQTFRPDDSLRGAFTNSPR